MVHGRNFDYPEQYIRSVIVSVGFVKGGAELYRGSLILPIIGIVDGIRPNVCSVSVNTRHKNSHQQPVGAKADKFSSFEGGVVGLLKRNWAAFQGGKFVGSEFAAAGAQPTTVSHLLRKTLETTTSFGSALRTLVRPTLLLSYPSASMSVESVGLTIRLAVLSAGDGSARWSVVHCTRGDQAGRGRNHHPRPALRRRCQDALRLRRRRAALGAGPDQPRPLARGSRAGGGRRVRRGSGGPRHGTDGAGAAGADDAQRPRCERRPPVRQRPLSQPGHAR